MWPQRPRRVARQLRRRRPLATPLLLVAARRFTTSGAENADDLAAAIGLDEAATRIASRILEELQGFRVRPEQLSDGLSDALMQLLHHSARVPPDFGQPSIDSQYALLGFTTEVAKSFRGPGWRTEVKSEDSHRAGHMISALLTASAALVPLCRLNAVCVVDKVSLALWRFANAGESLDHGFGRSFFDKMRPYLPETAQWWTPWQVPTTFYRGLEARPSWPLDTLPEGSAVQRVALALRAGATAVAEELHAGVLSEEGLALVREPAWTGLHQNGRWMAFSLYRAGGFFGRHTVARQLDPLHCRLVPRTCKILMDAGVPPGLVGQLPTLQGSQEVVDFLRADPGTRVTFHASSTNTRLSVSICLAGCDEGDHLSDRRSHIQAAEETLYWKFGEPIVFDDSFLHSALIDSAAKEPRWVLLVQVLHPAIDTLEKFAGFFASHAAAENDVRERASADKGGPPPPPVERGITARLAASLRPLLLFTTGWTAQ